MARVHGKDLTAHTLNSQTLLVDTIAINYKHSSQVHDTTTMGDDNVENTPGLIGGDSATIELFYNNTNTTGTWAFVTNLLGAAATTWSFTDGTRTVSVSVIVESIDGGFKVNDMAKMTVTLRFSGAVTYS